MAKPDLARAVAVEVMGWTELKDSWFHPEYGRIFGIHTWHPDTNIAGAWMVVERMRELGCVWMMQYGDDCGYVRCLRDGIDEGCVPYSTWLKEGSHERGILEAICLAALSFVREMECKRAALSAVRQEAGGGE